MKYIRNILLIITIICGLVMQTEVYQSMLWGFNGAYYLTSKYEITEEKEDAFITDIQEVAEEHDVHVLSTFIERKSNYQTNLYIYGDDEVIRDSLKSTMDIEEKVYTALIGGITTIEFKDFESVKTTERESYLLVSYIGSEDDIFAVYNELSTDYPLTEPEYWAAKETDMMLVVWGMVAILMIVLNIVEVIRRQKEVVVRISLGESAKVIALKSMVIDFVTYTLLFIFAKLLMAQFISGWYENKLVLAIYCMGAIFSVIPYMAFLHFDVRKAFANASDRKGMLYLLNGLKILATAMTILTISTNLSSIQGNLFASSNIMEKHYTDNYFNVMTLGDSIDGGFEAECEFWNKLYDNEYDILNPVICTGGEMADGDSCVFVNYNAKDTLQGFSAKINDVDTDADIVVFVPDGKKTMDSEIEREISSFIKNAADVNVVYVEYSDSETFYYLTSNREDVIDGVARTQNPILIYQASEEAQINGAYIEVESYNTEVIYNCRDDVIRENADKYAEPLQPCYYMFTNVEDDYNYSHSFLVKLISFVSSLCILVLLLDIAIIVSEVKLEFRLRAMEISLKKILGYSFYERHQRFIKANVKQNIFASVIVCIGTYLLFDVKIKTTLIIAVVITLMELAIIFANILWVEKSNVSKSLKGGCL